VDRDTVIDLAVIEVFGKDGGGGMLTDGDEDGGVPTGNLVTVAQVDRGEHERCGERNDWNEKQMAGLLGTLALVARRGWLIGPAPRASASLELQGHLIEVQA
jgi:hypothetical protein